MASRIGTWDPDGPAGADRMRRTAVVDVLIGILGGVMLWPFPLLRLTLGIPLPIHIALMVVFMGVFCAAAAGVAVAVWGRTVGQYLFDLALQGRARPFGWLASAAWGCGHAIDVIGAVLGLRASLDGRRGAAAAFSGLETVAAKTAAEVQYRG